MKAWDYQPSPTLGKRLKEKLKLFPREKDISFSFLRILWNGFLRLFLKVYFRFSVEGKEFLPKEKSFVLVANHTSHLDAICLGASLPLRRINKTFAVAAKDYFFSSFWGSFFSAVFINAVPFDRYAKQREGLGLCRDVMKEDQQTLILFPEGTRSKSGTMQPFKPGIGLLVAETSTLVLPVYIEGAHRAFPKKRFFPLPFKVKVRIGKPQSFAHVKATKEGFLQIASKLENAVRELQKI